MKKTFDNIPIIHHVINQLKNCKTCSKIIVATTLLDEDKEIVNYVKNLNIENFRGSESNVLDRYYHCAKKFGLLTIVRITCDNPLIDPTLVDDIITIFQSGNYDYISNCIERTFPLGTEVEVFSINSLEKAWKEANNDFQKEHVTPFFYQNPTKFKIKNISHYDNLSFLRWTVDTQSDFDFVNWILKNIKSRPVLMKNILKLLATNGMYSKKS